MRSNNEIQKQLKGRDFSAFLEGLPSREQIQKWLDQQTLSADAKSLLSKLIDTTIDVGGQIISIGRKIIATVVRLTKQFPNTSFGIVIGAVMTLLIGSIPIVGWILGPLLSPLLLAFGIGMGAIADFQTTKMKSTFATLLAEYEVLKAE